MTFTKQPVSSQRAILPKRSCGETPSLPTSDVPTPGAAAPDAAAPDAAAPDAAAPDLVARDVTARGAVACDVAARDAAAPDAAARDAAAPDAAAPDVTARGAPTRDEAAPRAAAPDACSATTSPMVFAALAAFLPPARRMYASRRTADVDERRCGAPLTDNRLGAACKRTPARRGAVSPVFERRLLERMSRYRCAAARVRGSRDADGFGIAAAAGVATLGFAARFQRSASDG